MLLGYLWAGGQRSNIEDKPKKLVMTEKQERDAKYFGIKPQGQYKVISDDNDEPFEVLHENWKYWQIFKVINDEFRYQAIVQSTGNSSRTVLIRTGIDGTAVISYLNLLKMKHKKRAFKMIKHIVTGVKQADKERLNP